MMPRIGDLPRDPNAWWSHPLAMSEYGWRVAHAYDDEPLVVMLGSLVVAFDGEHCWVRHAMGFGAVDK